MIIGNFGFEEVKFTGLRIRESNFFQSHFHMIFFESEESNLWILKDIMRKDA